MFPTTLRPCGVQAGQAGKVHLYLRYTVLRTVQGWRRQAGQVELEQGGIMADVLRFPGLRDILDSVLMGV